MSDAVESPASFVLGSSPHRADLYAELPTVSSRHARVFREQSEWFVEDLGSTNGTFINGERLLPDEPVPLAEGDELGLGRSLRVVFGPALRAAAAAAPAPIPGTGPKTAAAPPASPPADADERGATRQLTEEQVRALSELRPRGPMDAPLTITAAGSAGPIEAPAHDAATLSIGYAESNDVVVPNAVVSGRHARLYFDGVRFVIEDQSSTNGTWLEGRRVGRAEVRIGQQFRLGSYQMFFDEELAARLRALFAEDVEDAEEHVPFPAGEQIVVGRSAEADVVLDAPMVSSRHATLEVLPDRSGYLVRDHGSTNGTWLNQRDHRVVEARVRPDDVLFFGSYRLPVRRLPALVGERREATGAAETRTAEGQRVFIIGRDGDRVDVEIDAAVVSARHAEVTVRDDGRFDLRDLGSSNGTFVNGLRIRGRVTVGAEDRVSLGSCEVRLDTESGILRKEYHGDVMIRADRISVDVPDRRAEGGRRRILDDVSFTAYPTEFVGLMGPSGAGKTTLMMALNGYVTPSTGRSLINNDDLYHSYDSFRGTIGYVPQDDIVYPQLTVYESLYFTARLRLPSDTSAAEIRRKIDAVLQKLEIQHTRDTRIGDALSKGISGGERKRVNLAQELLTEPSLLFLDEPTSGLASEDTINVMRLLRGLADTGKTILLTIHQPSLEAYRLMDNVIYLFRGRLVYYGPAYPDSILHFGGRPESGPERERLLADPGNAMKPLAREQRAALETAEPDQQDEAIAHVVQRHREAFETSRYHREFVHDRADEGRDTTVRVKAPPSRTVRRGWFRQWRILTRRAALIKRKDRVNTAILTAQAPIIAAILAIVFSGGDGGYFDFLARGPKSLFLLVASAVWFGCSNAAREIVGEQAIYRRERMVNLRIPSYALSKVAVLGSIGAVQCLLLLAVVWWPLALEGAFAAHYLVLLLASLAGLGMGLTLSALVRTTEAAIALVPLLLIPQIILGGAIVPIHELPATARVLSDATAARWGYEAALHVEFGDDDLTRLRDACGIPACIWGTGQTGLTFTYYSGDPDDPSTSEASGGLEAVQGGVIPFVRPEDEGMCQAFCESVRQGEGLTPLDRSFGPDAADPERRRVEAEVPDAQRTAPAAHVRAGFGAACGALALMWFVFVGLVMAVLRIRDPEID